MRIQVSRRVVEEIVVPDEVIVKECINSIKQDSGIAEYVEDFAGGVEGYCKVLIQDVMYDEIWENPWWKDRTEVYEDVDRVERVEDIEDKDVLIEVLTKLIKGEE